MEINVKIQDLQQKKLFVAVPMYGGQCSGMFARSTNDLSALCARYNIELKFYYLFNESLITRARNYCADEFMRSDSTHLLFIDSDIGFNPHDVLTMLALSDGHPDINDGEPFDVLCGPYPKKCISWEKIKAAVDHGVADENPQELNNFVGDYVFNPANGTNQMPLSEPAEVMEGGTGFMMIRRHTFEMFNEAYPELLYRPDHVRTEHFDGSREIMCYFDALIDNKQTSLQRELYKFLDENPKATRDEIVAFCEDQSQGVDGQYSKRYLSEDYMFCQWVRKIGLKVWMCPWMQLQHVGTFTFGGSLSALASIGASATADASARPRKK